MQLFQYLKFIKAFALTMSLGFGVQASLHNHDCEDHLCNEERFGFKSGKAASGKWLKKSIPKRNWICSDIEDRGIQDLQCQMCEREYIRYVHTMEHPHYPSTLKVGCICAGHMEGDEDAEEAKERESYLKSRTQRRNAWLDRDWKTSGKGHLHIKTRAHQHDDESHHIIITKGEYGKYSAIIDGNFLSTWHPTIEEAQFAAFDEINPAKICYY